MRNRCFTILITILGTSAFQASQANELKCFGDGEVERVCVSLPDEKTEAEIHKEAFLAKESKRQKSEVPSPEMNGSQTEIPQATMVFPSDLWGGEIALDTEFAFGTPMDLRLEIEAGGENAINAATLAQNKLRSVEVFLKSGPAQGGDLSVISAGEKD